MLLIGTLSALPAIPARATIRGMATNPAILTFDVQGIAQADAPTRFRGVAYSGGVVPAYGPFGDTGIDIASFTIPDKKLFALVDHDPAQRAGHFTASMQDGQIVIEGELFQSTAAGREVAAIMAEGATWQLSVGIQADAQPVKGQVSLNGKPAKINTLFKNAMLREVSFVPVGADPNTSVAAFARNHQITLSPPPEEDTAMELAELQAKVAELDAKFQAADAARLKAESELTALRTDNRRKEMSALLTELGTDATDAALAPYLDISDVAFSAIVAQFKALKPAAPTAPAHLFKEQATEQTAGGETTAPTIAELNAKLITQIK